MQDPSSLSDTYGPARLSLGRQVRPPYPVPKHAGLLLGSSPVVTGANHGSEDVLTSATSSQTTGRVEGSLTFDLGRTSTKCIACIGMANNLNGSCCMGTDLCRD